MGEHDEGLAELTALSALLADLSQMDRDLLVSGDSTVDWCPFARLANQCMRYRETLFHGGAEPAMRRLINGFRGPECTIQ